MLTVPGNLQTSGKRLRELRFEGHPSIDLENCEHVRHGLSVPDAIPLLTQTPSSWSSSSLLRNPSLNRTYSRAWVSFTRYRPAPILSFHRPGLILCPNFPFNSIAAFRIDFSLFMSLGRINK
jgi:hypothetical protein